MSSASNPVSSNGVYAPSTQGGIVLREHLAQLTPRDWRTIKNNLKRAVHDLGLAYTIASDAAPRGFSWDIEPIPFVLEPEEWAIIEAGVRQRAQVFNRFLVDAYTHQEMIRQGIVPPELVLADPFYRRPCLGLEPDRESPANVLRFDLVRTQKDGWVVHDTYANTPIGISFAVQNRRLLTQEAADIFSTPLEFQSVANFPVQLLQRLRELSPRRNDNPSLVVLTAGPQDPAYFEHSFLARKMGVPLAQGEDLLVLDNKVYFKTIAGLERVDVIYRRLNDAHIDPVVFSTDRSTAGIPGLLSSIRSGHVAIANTIGVGLAENRGLLGYFARLSRFYLGEKSILPSQPTYFCGDVDQLQYVLDSQEILDLEPSHHYQTNLPSAFARRSPRKRRTLLNHLRRNPLAFVGREPLEAEILPSVPEAGLKPAEARLSCFALCSGKNIEVMPGGLARLHNPEEPFSTPPWQIGRTRDIVVISPSSQTEREEDLSPSLRVRPIILGSKAAENLFWTGRYAERADGSARMLSRIEDVGLEEIPGKNRKDWFPIWEGVLEATGHSGEKFTRGASVFSDEQAWQMVLDRRVSSSILSSVRATRENIRRMREYFSPESWSILNRLHARLTRLAEEAEPRPERMKIIALQGIDEVMTGLTSFFGTVERTMLHDAGWHFFQIGVHLERAIMTCSGLRHGLTEAENAAREERREEADLTALVRMLSSQDAYRRTYQARSEPLFVAELFLLNGEAPRSVYLCVADILDSLRTLFGRTAGHDDRPVQLARACLDFLEELDLDSYFKQRTNSPRLTPPSASAEPQRDESGPPPTPLGDLLENLLIRLNGLGDALHDVYLSHQASIVNLRQQELAL